MLIKKQTFISQTYKNVYIVMGSLYKMRGLYKKRRRKALVQHENSRGGYRGWEFIDSFSTGINKCKKCLISPDTEKWRKSTHGL